MKANKIKIKIAELRKRKSDISYEMDKLKQEKNDIDVEISKLQDEIIYGGNSSENSF